MKRPDASIIRRALKRGRLVVGDTTKLGEAIKLGLDLPLMSFTGKDFKDTDTFAFSDSHPETALNEPVFDEWVIHYEQDMTLEVRSRGRSFWNSKHADRQEHVNAEVWTCFLDPMHPPRPPP